MSDGLVKSAKIVNKLPQRSQRKK